MLKGEEKLTDLQELMLKGYNIRLKVEDDKARQKDFLNKELWGIGKGILDISTLRGTVEKEEKERKVYEGEELQGVVQGYVKEILGNVKNVVYVVEEEDREYLPYLYENGMQFIILEEDYNIMGK